MVIQMEEFMDTSWGVEFSIRIGDFSQIGDLSDVQLTKLIREEEYEIHQAKRDRRLKQRTRDRRIADATFSREELLSELLSRIERRNQAKMLAAFMDRVKKRDNIHPFHR